MKNPYFSLLSTGWQYASKAKKSFVQAYVLLILFNIIVAIHPLLFGWYINSLQKETEKVLWFTGIYGAGYIGLRFLEWLFFGPARVKERELAFHLSSNFLNESYHQILNMPLKWHKDHHSGDTISRLNKAYWALRDFFQNGFIYINIISKLIFSFAAMLYFSPVFAVIGGIIGVLTIWITMKFDKPFIKTLKHVNEREHKVFSTLFDSLSNIISVITLRLEDRMKENLNHKVKKVFFPFKLNIVINEWKWFTAQTLIGIIYAICIFGYVYQNWQPGTIFMIGGLVALTAYVNQFTSVFNDIAHLYGRLIQYNTDLEQIKPIKEAYQKQIEKIKGEKFPERWKTITINNVNFSHLSEKGINFKNHLENINLKIKKGQKIAFIGESGSGKSTLLATLRGLYQPDEAAEVNLDTREKISFETLAHNITLFPQEPEIFDNSILYNITLGLPFSEAEVMEVCEIARFSEVVKKLPSGINTHIKEKGVNLSGGQKQRLALARGILAARNSDIILMDEPTSSVDPKTEINIYKNIFNAFEGKALISSLHRLHLLPQFDYIYIMEEGAIVDEGPFLSLLYSSPVFQEIWKHQEEAMGAVVHV